MAVHEEQNPTTFSDCKECECSFWKDYILFSTLHSYLQIRYWSAYEKEVAANRVQVSNQNFSVRLENLRPNTRYTAEVYAFNSAGFGPASNRLYFTTQKARKSCSLCTLPLMLLVSVLKNSKYFCRINRNSAICLVHRMSHQQCPPN